MLGFEDCDCRGPPRIWTANAKLFLRLPTTTRETVSIVVKQLASYSLICSPFLGHLKSKERFLRTVCLLCFHRDVGNLQRVSMPTSTAEKVPRLWERTFS